MNHSDQTNTQQTHTRRPKNTRVESSEQRNRECVKCVCLSLPSPNCVYIKKDANEQGKELFHHDSTSFMAFVHTQICNIFFFAFLCLLLCSFFYYFRLYERKNSRRVVRELCCSHRLFLLIFVRCVCAVCVHNAKNVVSQRYVLIAQLVSLFFQLAFVCFAFVSLSATFLHFYVHIPLRGSFAGVGATYNVYKYMRFYAANQFVFR